MILKYVVYKTERGLENIVVFCEEIVHSQVVVEDHTPVSAGFINFENDFECFGSSDSLGLKSRVSVDSELFILAITPQAIRAFLRADMEVAG